MVGRDEDWITRRIGKGNAARRYFDVLRGTKWNEYPYGSGVFLWLDYILPGFPEEAVISLREGFTDLFKIPAWLQKRVGLSRLFIKQEGQLPSQSFKARGLAVAVSDAFRLQLAYPELKLKRVACASTGDTSAAASIYADYEEGLGCLVLLPAGKVSPEQLAQVRAYGADILLIDHPDGFDRCMELIEEYCDEHTDTVLVNSKNDMRLVGQETAALEICQELNWEVPDWIAIPVGNGGNLTSYLVSLLRMKERGLISRLPGIIAAQTEGANTLVRWARSGFQEYKPGNGSRPTLATAMYIQDPVSFPRIQKLASNFDIRWFDVPEKELKKVWALFLRSGADVCPQGAVALHAVLQARDGGIVKENHRVVSIATASFLKFVNAATQNLQGLEGFAEQPPTVRGTREAVEQALAV